MEEGVAVAIARDNRLMLASLASADRRTAWLPRVVSGKAKPLETEALGAPVRPCRVATA
jgi:hypothetical protein